VKGALELDVAREALLVSVWGMTGIFITMALIGGITVVLMKLFPGR
jgi:hypothetical protein